MSELKDAGILFNMALTAIRRLDLDEEKLLTRLGFNHHTLQDIDSGNFRTPHSAQQFFWQVLEEFSEDPDIGLHLGQKLPVFKGQVLEYLFLSSPSFGEGLTRALNYQRLISDAATSSLKIADDACYLEILTQSSEVQRLRHCNECLSQGLITFFQAITEGQFKISKVHFAHEKPENWREVERVFNCPVNFAQSSNQLHFDCSMLELKSQHAEPELMALHEKLASEKVAQLEKLDMIAKVEKVIAELLESGEVTLEVVSERLGIRPRSLRAKLTEANSSFNQILADYRYRLARRLLGSTNESIDEIVYLTGFSEPSTFYRAFKRWSEMTPIEYRRHRQDKRNRHLNNANT